MNTALRPIIAALLLVAGKASATDFVVTNTSTSSATAGSLPAAVAAANADCSTAPHTIRFAIPGAAPFAIATPVSLTCATTVDGTSQAGSGTLGSLGAGTAVGRLGATLTGTDVPAIQVDSVAGNATGGAVVIKGLRTGTASASRTLTLDNVYIKYSSTGRALTTGAGATIAATRVYLDDTDGVVSSATIWPLGGTINLTDSYVMASASGADDCYRAVDGSSKIFLTRSFSECKTGETHMELAFGGSAILSEVTMKGLSQRVFSTGTFEITDGAFVGAGNATFANVGAVNQGATSFQFRRTTFAGNGGIAISNGGPNGSACEVKISSALLQAGNLNFSGTACANATVDFFRAAPGAGDGTSPNTYGEGDLYLGTAVANGAGAFTLSAPAQGLVVGSLVTGYSTTTGKITSEFGKNVAVVACVTNADCNDGIECSTDTCNVGGTCSNAAAAAGTTCATGICNGTNTASSCVACLDSSPTATDTGCLAAAPHCRVAGTGAPVCEVCADTSVGGQDLGCGAAAPNCAAGAGGVFACIACESDAQCNDGLECSTDRCNNGACTATPLAAGQACTTGACTDAVTCAALAVTIATPAKGSTISTPNPGVYTGTGNPGVEVVVLVDGAEVGRAIVAANGTWSLPAPGTLADGSHTLEVRESVGALSANDSGTFRIDSQSAIAITNPLNGAVVSASTPISGTAEPGATVTVKVDGQVIGTVVASASGTWTVAPTTPFSAGNHAVEATAVDGQNNTAVANSSFSVAAAQADAGAPTGDAGNQSGALSILSPTPGTITSDSTPDFEGTGVPGATVTVYVDGVLVGSSTIGADGRWTLTASTPLTEGPHAVSARAQKGTDAPQVAFTDFVLVLRASLEGGGLSCSAAPVSGESVVAFGALTLGMVLLVGRRRRRAS